MTHNRRIENSAEHHEVSALLPWYVNETLQEQDHQRVDAHIGICAACREDLAAQRRIFEAIAAQPAIDYMPVASLKRLHARLDAQAESNAMIVPMPEPVLLMPLTVATAPPVIKESRFKLFWGPLINWCCGSSRC